MQGLVAPYCFKKFDGGIITTNICACWKFKIKKISLEPSICPTMSRFSFAFFLSVRRSVRRCQPFVKYLSELDLMLKKELSQS